MFVRAHCLLTTAICAGGLIASAAAYAADIKPAIIYDLGGKFDKSFNEGVANGATKFEKDTGVKFRDFEIQNDAQREQALRNFAKDGYLSDLARRLRPGDARSSKSPTEFPNTNSASSTWSSTSRMCSRSCSRTRKARSWSA